MCRKVLYSLVMSIIVLTCIQGVAFSANSIPTLTSISPASGIVKPGVWMNFTCVYTDLNGASDLTKCKLVVNSTISGSGGAYLTYDKAVNKLYMTNNAGTQIGGIVKGTAGTIETESAILNCATTTATSSGNNLTIVWKVQFKPVMAGKKCDLYMNAYDVAGATSGWKDKGNFNINVIPTLTSISPASGIVKPGVWKTFTCVYSDLNGSSDLTKCKLVINNTISGSGGAYLTYDRATGKLYMNNNAGTEIGGVVKGAAGTVETESAILNCATTTATSSGNNLTIAWKVQFKSVMAGKKCDLYMNAYDVAGGTSGWKDKGNFSINALPTLTSISPASGIVQPGVWKTFTCVYSDLNTASDLTKCKLVINNAISGSGGAYLTYDRATGKLYMNNNAGTQIGGIVKGAAGTVETESAILNCATTTATSSGNNLTIAWKVQLKPVMAGKKCNLYMNAYDAAGGTSGWVDKGDYSVNAPPTLTSVSPSSGFVQAGAWKTFTCVYSDLNGASDLTMCKLVVNNAISGSGGAYLTYNRATGKLYMNNNASTQIGGLVKGLTGTIETESAILDCGATTATTSGNNLTIAWRVQCKPVMAGKSCNLYMTASDVSGSSSGWLSKGTYSISAPTASSLIELGKSRINSVVMMEPFNPTIAKTLLTEAKSYFLQAKGQTLTNAENAQANFGLAITDAALTAQDMVDKYKDSFTEEGAGPMGLKSAVATLQFMNLPNMVKGTEPLKGFVDSYTKAATSLNYTTMSEESQMILDIQTDIKNVIRPMLERVGGYLQIVETYGGSSFSFPMGTTSWDGYTLVDIGDVNLFHGALLATRWALAIPASYNLNMGSYNVDVSPYDRDINHNGLLTPSEYVPASPCLTLTSSATMTGAKLDMTTACDKIIAGINATLAETSDNYDLIKWHTPNEGPTQAELLEIKSYVTQLKTSMNSAVTITIDEEDEPVSFRIFAGAWNTNPPADLKAMFPTQELVRWRNNWEGEYDYGMIDAENGFPDDTFGGIFPDGMPLHTESRTVTVYTGGTGTLTGMYTEPENNATNVWTGIYNLTVNFPNNPPAVFSVNLQRYFAGEWRNVPLYRGWIGGLNNYFGFEGNLWPNSNYRMIIKDENHGNSVTRTFQTDDDEPFGQGW